MRGNHELHETHESDGVADVMRRADETPHNQRLFTEVCKQGDRKATALEVVDDLCFLDGPHARLGLEFEQDFPVTNEICAVHGFQDAAPESYGNRDFTVDWDGPVGQGHLDGLLVGFLQVSRPQLCVHVQEGPNDGIGQRGLACIEHSAPDSKSSKEPVRSLVGAWGRRFVRFVKFVVPSGST